MNLLYVIAFSKDRPFQLLHALDTCLRHVRAEALRVVVIYSLTGSPQFASAYDEVARAVPDATFILEEEGRFFAQVEDLVGEASDKGGAIMWVVDDMLFYRDMQARSVNHRQCASDLARLTVSDRFLALAVAVAFSSVCRVWVVGGATARRWTCLSTVRESRL